MHHKQQKCRSLWQLTFPANPQQLTIFSKQGAIISVCSAFISCSCDFILHQAQYAALWNAFDTLFFLSLNENNLPSNHLQAITHKPDILGRFPFQSWQVYEQQEFVMFCCQVMQGVTSQDMVKLQVMYVFTEITLESVPGPSFWMSRG